MKSVRLKNIVIVILALLNFFLLMLLLSEKIQQNNAQRRSVEQLQQLFADNNLSLSADIPAEQESVPECAITADSSAVGAFADSLLGQSIVSESSGGARFDGERGTCLLRANGSVEASFHDFPIEKPLDFCRELFKAYGYEILSADLEAAKDTASSGSGTIIGTRCADGAVIYNVSLSFTFSGGKLNTVNGVFLPEITFAEGAGGISAITALVNFLNYYNSVGLVCTGVTSIQSGYLLQGFATSQLRLAPVWYIETDVSSFYVDLQTGEVSRA